MRDRATPKRCHVQRCRQPAAYAFLAVTGDQVEKLTTGDGTRIRACRPHLLTTVDQIKAAFAQLPGGGPARVRAVPLSV